MLLCVRMDDLIKLIKVKFLNINYNNQVHTEQSISCYAVGIWYTQIPKYPHAPSNPYRN